MANKNYILRTMLFIPGHVDKLMINALKTSADALIFDLEDSCKPDKNKKIARQLIKEKIESGIFDKFHTFVRINPRGTKFLLEDVLSLTVNGLSGFLYPMAKSRDDIIFFDNLLEEIELSKNIEVGTFKIFPVIESAGGILNAREICSSSNRIVALGFGGEDYTTDIESIRDEEGESIFYARSVIAHAARAEGIVPIDTPHLDIHNLKRLRSHCMTAKNLGFGGLQILHPKEIEIVNETFSKTKQEIDDAKEMIRLYKEAEKENRGVAIYNGRFIGPPLVKRAKKIIESNHLLNDHLKNRE